MLQQGAFLAANHLVLSAATAEHAADMLHGGDRQLCQDVADVKHEQQEDKPGGPTDDDQRCSDPFIIPEEEGGRG